MEVNRSGKLPGSPIENLHKTKAGPNVPPPALEKPQHHLGSEKNDDRQTGNVPETAAVRQLLSIMGIPFSKESAAAAELVIEFNPALSKKEMQAAIGLLKKFEFKESTAVLRFMLQHQIVVSEAVFQSLLTARQGPSLTSQLQTLQAALTQSKEVAQHSFPSINQLLEINADLLENQLPSTMWKAKLALLGIDNEAQIARDSFDLPARSVKQELLQILTQTLPAPMRELAEQVVGKLNAQHILSAESGALQQIVMQIPVCLPAFQGDITVKWEGKKKNNGQIDADFCRVFFWLQMPHLGNTTIDMQVQNRIVHLTIAAEKNSSQLKALSKKPADVLKQALEENGYFLSGLACQAFAPAEHMDKTIEPAAQIMDERRQMEVDIRI